MDAGPQRAERAILEAYLRHLPTLLPHARDLLPLATLVPGPREVNLRELFRARTSRPGA